MAKIEEKKVVSEKTTPFADILKLIPENQRISKKERDSQHDMIHEVPSGRNITKTEKATPEKNSYGRDESGLYANIQNKPY